MEIKIAEKTGFCFGVKRALTILEKVAGERGGVETLGAIVHNQQVLQKLAGIGVVVVRDVKNIKGDTVVTSSHGVSPDVEEAIRARQIRIISTTCPFVRRAQLTARRFADSGFFVVVYGDADHPEVEGILGWAGGKGVATLDEKFIAGLDRIPRRLGILSQTTQIPAQFNDFVKRLIDATLTKDSEIRIMDTICHDIRERQAAALSLAEKVDLMLVVGGRFSANTRRLAELCSTVTGTHSIETATEIKPSWLKGLQSIGITAGASTAEDTVKEVLVKLKELSS